ncbi:Uptake hydrogenase large subunit [Trichinella spiralis]|uniref:Uptake hydrogenase large subunit n=1 Tax=Trichinella spiralis TaxID=6334 RepID=A0ABR3K4H3_TRISP
MLIDIACGEHGHRAKITAYCSQMGKIEQNLQSSLRKEETDEMNLKDRNYTNLCQNGTASKKGALLSTPPLADWRGEFSTNRANFIDPSDRVELYINLSNSSQLHRESV